MREHGTVGHTRRGRDCDSMRLKHLLCLLSAVAGIFATENESYDELLRLKPLPNGKVLATFTFTTTTNDWSSPKTHSPSEQGGWPGRRDQILQALTLPSSPSLPLVSYHPCSTLAPVLSF